MTRRVTPSYTVGFFLRMKGGMIMKRIFLATGVLVLGLATLRWVTTSISAPHGGGVIRTNEQQV